MTNMLMIDNQWGISVNLAGNYEEQLATVEDSTFIGELEGMADDCPEGHECFCRRKYGFMMSYATHKAKPPHLTESTAWPMEKAKSYSSDYSDTNFNRLTFKNWKS